MIFLTKNFYFFHVLILSSLYYAKSEKSKQNDPIAKYLYANEKLCGDLFADANWLPAQFTCRIKCNVLQEVCMTGVNINDKIFTCRRLPNECSEKLKSHIISIGLSLEEFQINEPQGPPLLKKFNDVNNNLYTMPPSLEPHPPSMAPDDLIYDNDKDKILTTSQEFIIEQPSTTTPYIDHAKNYQEELTQNSEEPFTVQSNIYESSPFIQPTPAPFYNPETVPTISNYVTTAAPFTISNELIDSYGISESSSSTSSVIQPSTIYNPPTTSQMNMLPSINYFQQNIPTINVKPSIPTPRYLQQTIPSINIQPSKNYYQQNQNYVMKPEPAKFHIPTPVFTYNLHNSNNFESPPGYGPTKVAPLQTSNNEYNQRNKLQHVPTSPSSKYGYYFDGHGYHKNTWKQANQKMKKKMLYSNSGFFNGLRDHSIRCCDWALNGMCDGHWQKIRVLCPKSCGTVICTTGEGKTGCNRAIDVNVYDCHRKNTFYSITQQNNLMNEDLSRPLYNQFNNYRSSDLSYENNNNNYLNGAYSIENEMIGWRKMFRGKV
uniref:ShKT domain-containing protein n=1 Tax=Parastrongyloides trichosuri TaxID=131310 RepID=A0A0N4Z332_PARTI